MHLNLSVVISLRLLLLISLFLQKFGCHYTCILCNSVLLIPFIFSFYVYLSTYKLHHPFLDSENHCNCMRTSYGLFLSCIRIIVIATSIYNLGIIPIERTKAYWKNDANSLSFMLMRAIFIDVKSWLGSITNTHTKILLSLEVIK